MTLATTAPSAWVEFRKEPCWACGHNDGWCTRTKDGKLVRCHRRQSDRPIVGKDGTAWLHFAEDLNGTEKLHADAPKEYAKKLTTAQCKQLQKQFVADVNPEKLEAFAKQLGVSVKSLQAYGVGWSYEYMAWTWPWRNAQRVIVGFGIRYLDGKGVWQKKCYRGSGIGLIIPDDYEAVPLPEEVSLDMSPLLLAVPEGLTDCCAARDLGFRAVGRPNNRAGADTLRELLSLGPPQHVVIVGERDSIRAVPKWPAKPEAILMPGIDGALDCCRAVLGAWGKRGRLQFMLPPRRCKDLREWMLGGRRGKCESEWVDKLWLARRGFEVRRDKERALRLLTRLWESKERTKELFGVTT